MAMLGFLVPILDGSVIFLCWFASIDLRLAMGAEAPATERSLRLALFLIALTVFIFSRSGLYDPTFLKSRSGRPFGILKANMLSVLSFIMINYFFQSDRLPRGAILIYAPISFFFIFFVRRIYIEIRYRWFPIEKVYRRVVLVGDGEPFVDFLKSLNEQNDFGSKAFIQIIGWYEPPPWSANYKIAQLSKQQLASCQYDDLIVSYKPENSGKIDGFVQEFYNDFTPISILPTFNSYARLGVHVDQIGHMPMLTLNQPRHNFLDMFFKRLLDIFGSLFGLIILSPLFLILSTLIKLTSRGPIFFGQKRMGLDGQTFTIWKFRTMQAGPSEPGWTVQNDPRRTRLGIFLRSSSLDELPQLWNVLVGEMSLVGPRPEQPHYVESFRHQVPAYMLRHKMKAGITGWAQVNGWRGNTSIHKRIECDFYYIKNWTLWFDVEILLRTIWNGFINRNAY